MQWGGGGGGAGGGGGEVGLAGNLHGLGSGLAVQGPGGAALQQAVEVGAAATAVHGGDAGRGGGAGASQTSHSC